MPSSGTPTLPLSAAAQFFVDFANGDWLAVSTRLHRLVWYGQAVSIHVVAALQDQARVDLEHVQMGSVFTAVEDVQLTIWVDRDGVHLAGPDPDTGNDLAELMAFGLAALVAEAPPAYLKRCDVCCRFFVGISKKSLPVARDIRTCRPSGIASAFKPRNGLLRLASLKKRLQTQRPNECEPR